MLSSSCSTRLRFEAKLSDPQRWMRRLEAPYVRKTRTGWIAMICACMYETTVSKCYLIALPATRAGQSARVGPCRH